MSTQQTAPQTKTALERLEALEQDVSKMANLVAVIQQLATNVKNANNTVSSLKTALENTAKGLDSTLGVLIQKNVLTAQEVLSEQMKIDATQKQNTENALIKQGLFTEALEVSDDSVVVIKQSDKDSGSVLSLRDFLEMTGVDEDMKSKFRGQSVGAKFTIESVDVEILRILNPVKQGGQSSENTSGESQG